MYSWILDQSLAAYLSNMLFDLYKHVRERRRRRGGGISSYRASTLRDRERVQVDDTRHRARAREPTGELLCKLWSSVRERRNDRLELGAYTAR